ncbi:MAG: hypothetical protein ACLS58_07725 [Sutterella wadsworthensis]
MTSQCFKESGKMQLASEPFDLAGIIDDVTLFTSSSATAKALFSKRPSIPHRTDVCRRSHAAQADTDEPFIHALKFVDENGKVTLVESLRRTGRQSCTLHRLNNRIGMSNAFQKQMFLPFEQDAPRRKGRGAGWGLPLSAT